MSGVGSITAQKCQFCPCSHLKESYYWIMTSLVKTWFRTALKLWIWWKWTIFEKWTFCYSQWMNTLSISKMIMKISIFILLFYELEKRSLLSEKSLFRLQINHIRNDQVLGLILTSNITWADEDVHLMFFCLERCRCM